LFRAFVLSVNVIEVFMEVELLSRIQFAGMVAFHYLFPPLSIGLGLILVMMEATYLRTRSEKLLEMTKFWTRIFGLIFAMGVASGIVMEFQFGTNWAAYSRYVGDVFGSALAAEGIFAFFLESGFLAVVLFGWDKVKPVTHFFSTCMVCLGAHFSAIWIIVANSWQQTPAGYHIVTHNGQARAEVTDFWAVVFNPSSVDRLVHVTLGAYMAGAFFVASVSAFYLLKGRHREVSVISLKIALVVAVVASSLQLLSGHRSALIVAEHQPAKLAAMEGHFETRSNAPIHPFGWVDEENERVIGLKIPNGLSLLRHHDAAGEVIGLDEFEKEDRPPLQLTFQSFHVMVAMGGLIILVGWWGMFLWWRGTLFDPSRWMTKVYLLVVVFSVLLPQVANQTGWIAAEVGRQPWIVYGELRTSDAHSAVVDANQVIFSLCLFGAIYLLLFILFIFLLDRKIRQGPGAHVEDETSAKRYVPGSQTTS
jgi:cytochrome d ubiquinol oxidase subunit I